MKNKQYDYSTKIKLGALVCHPDVSQNAIAEEYGINQANLSVWKRAFFPDQLLDVDLPSRNAPEEKARRVKRLAKPAVRYVTYNHVQVEVAGRKIRMDAESAEDLVTFLHILRSGGLPDRPQVHELFAA